MICLILWLRLKDPILCYFLTQQPKINCHFLLSSKGTLPLSFSISPSSAPPPKNATSHHHEPPWPRLAAAMKPKPLLRTFLGDQQKPNSMTPVNSIENHYAMPLFSSIIAPLQKSHQMTLHPRSKTPQQLLRLFNQLNDPFTPFFWWNPNGDSPKTTISLTLSSVRNHPKPLAATPPVSIIVGVIDHHQQAPNDSPSSPPNKSENPPKPLYK